MQLRLSTDGQQYDLCSLQHEVYSTVQSQSVALSYATMGTSKQEIWKLQKQA